ncbi:MAG: hypothetical protein EBT33_20720, partial [Betaproteobacteria bacterium]|nr:hypothetical protein [Betaproteobacteria bacterium]
MGVTLAFNTIGYKPQNLFANIADSIFGSSFADQKRAATRAWADNTSFQLDGGLEVQADWAGEVEAVIENSAVAMALDTVKPTPPAGGAGAAGGGAAGAAPGQSAITIAPVVALNRIAADTSARIFNARSTEAAGDIVVEATGETAINAEVSASALSVAAGYKGGSKSISVGLSLARNDIDSNVASFISATPIAATALGAQPTLVEVRSTGGEIRVAAWRSGEITALGTASAIAISASPNGGPAVAGGGTLAFNRISGSTEAYASRVLLATDGEDEGSGDVTIRTHDSTMIDASLRSVAAAVSVGRGSSKAVALGISVARNIIGQTPVAASYDYKASDYQPDDKKLTELLPGKRVLNDTALMGNEVYEYVGEKVTSTDGIRLHTQNFSDESLWKLVSFAPSVAATRAYLDRSQVEAAGALKLRALSSAGINARVLSGAAAVGAGATGSTTVSAAGVYAENRIYTSVDARIFGTEDRRAELAAASASIRSESRTAISALAGAASVAASFGASGKALSVSIGLSLAFNSIEADTTATMQNVHLVTLDGDVDIGARSAGLESGPTIDWEDIENAGLDEYALDAAAKASAETSFTSNEGQEWDYLLSDGETDLESGDKVLAPDGLVFEYIGDDATLDLGDVDLNNEDQWEQVEIDTVELKTGYTVRVDAMHNYGGVPGLVYRYIGTDIDHTTQAGSVVLQPDQVVLVDLNHAEPGWVGRAFTWKGAQDIEVDLAVEDFQNEDRWEEVSLEEEEVSLWNQDYSDTSRWQLATDFADADTVQTLTTIIEDAGIDLADRDMLRANALYSTADGTIWKYTNEDGEVSIEEGDLVADVDDDNAIYEYLGDDEEAFNLDEADFSDEDLWERVEPDTVELRKGDTVKIAPSHGEGGTAGAVYRYFGKNNQSVNLSTVDYTDDSQWELVKPELNLAVIEPGQSWRIVDGAGDSYTIVKRLRADGSYDVSVNRVNINAVSVAASAAIGVSAGGQGLAFSGAGAIAVNTIRGNTDALIIGSVVESAGDLKVSASSD